MKNILVTGGAGFVGSHLAISVKKRWKGAHVIALDNLSRRGSKLNIPRLKANGIQFVRGDVRRKADLNFKKLKISLLIECSADPSVLAGFHRSPQYVIDTNLMGTINCLELARRHKADFIFLSTSRVYPIEQLKKIKIKNAKTRFVLAKRQIFAGVSQKGISEQFPLDGWRSIYGTTKLSAELMIQEYIHTYNLRAVINRCGVIAGPWQMGKVDQGIFSFWLLSHYFKKNLQYIGFDGEGRQVRDLLHVDDLCRLIHIQINNLSKINGRVYNVGGGVGSSLSLLETTEICRRLTGNHVTIKKIKKNREADIPIYISDNTLVTKDTGWKPQINPEAILKDIHQWVESNAGNLRRSLFR